MAGARAEFPPARAAGVDHAYAGGEFTSYRGAPNRGLVFLDPATGDAL